METAAVRTANVVLYLISDKETMILRALNGRRCIARARETFKFHIDHNFKDWGLDKEGIATPETEVQVHEMEGNGTFQDIFGALPGAWEEKWLSQDQVIEFCECHRHWLTDTYLAGAFLCKINEDQPVDEAKPQDNLFFMNVFGFEQRLYTYVYKFNHPADWGTGRVRRFIVPKLLFPVV